MDRELSSTVASAKAIIPRTKLIDPFCAGNDSASVTSGAVKDVFPSATWLGSISAFRVRVGSFNYRYTRASVRRKAGEWQSTINWTDCRSPVQLTFRPKEVQSS
jgi:hypothetical protein